MLHSTQIAVAPTARPKLPETSSQPRPMDSPMPIETPPATTRA
jgi:hypothetical protein